jgi:HK97 family phage portal protein
VSILDAIKSAFRDAGRQPPPMNPVELRSAGGAVPPSQRDRPTWPRANVAAFNADGYARVPVVFACVNAQARAISAASAKVYEERPGGQRDEIADHPLRRLLRAPNPAMSEAEFWVLLWSLVAVAGFTVVEKVRSPAGRVVELWPLRPDWLRPILREQRAPDWEYRVPGHLKPFVLKSEDAIPVTYGPSLTLDPTGLAPIAVALRQVGIEASMTDFVKLFFEKGATPQYALTFNADVELDQARANLIKAMWTQRYGGYENWVEPALLESVSDVKRIGLDFDEMAYPELHAITQLDICAAFGVPPQMVGLKIALEVGAYENYANARRQFYEDTVSPLWARIDGAFSRGLLPDFDARPNVALEFDTTNIPALATDEKAKWDRATAALGAGGITLDQFLAEIGQPELPGGKGKVLYVPFSVTVTPLADLGAPPEPLPPATNPPPALPSGEEDEDDDQPPGVPAKGTGRGAISVRVLYPLPPERKAAFVTTHRQAMAKLARFGAPKLRAFWKAQGERIAAEAVKSALVPDRRDVAAIDWDDELRLLTQTLGSFHDLNGKTAFAGVAKQLGVGIDWDLANPNVRRLLSDLATRIVGVHNQTRNDVRQIVGDALDEGVTLQELSDRLKSLFVESYRSRAMTVARTETMTAYSKASVLAYDESGVVASVEIADNPAHDADYGASDGLTCASRNGLIVPLGQADRHIEAEHPNGSLVCLPVLATPLGEV